MAFAMNRVNDAADALLDAIEGDGPSVRTTVNRVSSEAFFVSWFPDGHLERNLPALPNLRIALLPPNLITAGLPIKCFAASLMFTVSGGVTGPSITPRLQLRGFEIPTQLTPDFARPLHSPLQTLSLHRPPSGAWANPRRGS